MSGTDSETQARVIRKFELLYMMAKESIPLTKYPALSQLEQCHELDMGHTYNTPESAKSFTSFINLRTSLNETTTFIAYLWMALNEKMAEKVDRSID